MFFVCMQIHVLSFDVSCSSLEQRGLNMQVFQLWFERKPNLQLKCQETTNEHIEKQHEKFLSQKRSLEKRKFSCEEKTISVWGQTTILLFQQWVGKRWNFVMPHLHWNVTSAHWLLCASFFHTHVLMTMNLKSHLHATALGDGVCLLKRWNCSTVRTRNALLPFAEIESCLPLWQQFLVLGILYY